MKKLLLSSVVLFLFSASILMFQMSCKKEAKADNLSVIQNDVKQLGKILYTTGPLSDIKVFMCNYDGSDKQQINLTFPEGIVFFNSLYLSPDGKKIFSSISTGTSTNSKIQIYSWDIDGGNRKLVMTEQVQLHGVY